MTDPHLNPAYAKPKDARYQNPAYLVAKATGQKTFYSGKPCKHGHDCERYTQSYMCVECAKWRYEQTKLLRNNGLRSIVLQKTGGKCWYCGADLSSGRFHLDHFYPRSSAGAEGLVPSCTGCNGAKLDKNLEEFRATRARQLDGRPYFGYSQKAYLVKIGFTFPPLPEYKFWFELNGMPAP